MHVASYTCKQQFRSISTTHQLIYCNKHFCQTKISPTWTRLQEQFTLECQMKASKSKQCKPVCISRVDDGLTKPHSFSKPKLCLLQISASYLHQFHGNHEATRANVRLKWLIYWESDQKIFKATETLARELSHVYKGWHFEGH